MFPLKVSYTINLTRAQFMCFRKIVLIEDMILFRSSLSVFQPKHLRIYVQQQYIYLLRKFTLTQIYRRINHIPVSPLPRSLACAKNAIYSLYT
mmetsp:Transcript_21639/g.43403  ORF Transcript_21639/g.43403 Transcript_21639/m.43403 type:complete len:93 (-) Transcript_21639:35-313(-)